MRLLARLLRGFIKTGTLELTDAHGRKYLFGAAPGPAVVARIHDSALHTRLALNPELAAAEAYMDGTLTFEGGSTAHDLLLLFSVNRSALGAVASQKLLRRAWRAMRRRHQANTAARATDNARSHYDVPVGVYRLFLDAGLNYSCAFFHDPETDTLEQAQEAKLARATAKLGLRPGMRVAEIGSGWGSFAVHIAKSTGARVTAINVSPEQLAVSRMLAEREGVTDLMEFLELDYRALEGRFDRVVSVGMMEHVGIGHFDAYPAKIRSAVGGGEDPRINGAGLWYSAPFCGDDAAVLAAVQHASRRLPRCPAECWTATVRGVLRERRSGRRDGRLDRITGLVAADTRIVDGLELWRSASGAEWCGTIELSERFHEQLLQHAVPLDRRGIAHLAGNSLGLDIYALLAYRLPRLQREVHLRWTALQEQIGSNEREAFTHNSVI